MKINLMFERKYHSIMLPEANTPLKFPFTNDKSTMSSLTTVSIVTRAWLISIDELENKEVQNWQYSIKLLNVLYLMQPLLYIYIIFVRKQKHLLLIFHPIQEEEKTLIVLLYFAWEAQNGAHKFPYIVKSLHTELWICRWIFRDSKNKSGLVT